MEPAGRGPVLSFAAATPEGDIVVGIADAPPATLVLAGEAAEVPLAEIDGGSGLSISRIRARDLVSAGSQAGRLALRAGEGCTSIVFGGRPLAATVDAAGERAAPQEVRLDADDDGDVVVRLSEAEPWAEYHSGSIDEAGLRCIVRPVRAAGVDRAEFVARGGARLPARTTPTDGTLAIELGRETLSRCEPGDYVLRVLTQGAGRLRVAKRLGDVTDPERSLVPPSWTGPVDAGWRRVELLVDSTSTRLRVTDHAQRPDGFDELVAAWEMDGGDLDEDTPSRPTPAVSVLRLLGSALVTLLEGWVHRGGRAATADPEAVERRRVCLLIATVHASGGTIRATTNVANGLARRPGNDVELVSVYRLRKGRYYALEDGVERFVLADEWRLERAQGWKARLAGLLFRVPSVLIHRDDPRHYRFSLGSDLKLYRWIRSVRGGAIVTTRSGLSIAVARFARPGVTLVCQQHVPFSSQSARLQRDLAAAYRRSDAVCVLTAADEAEVRDAIGEATPIHRLPNPLFVADAPKPDLDRPLIVCGGRLTPTKGIDVLIDAFGRAAPSLPGWQLRIYGSARADRLEAAREFVRRAGVADRVLLMPPSRSFELELTKGSICVVPSRHEAFGMVIIEAMKLGVPVIATDCPNGPREIIDDGVDGLLVPSEDPAALAAAIERLAADRDLRERLAAAGREKAAQFSQDAIAARLETIIDEARA